jgi:UDP-4-amino-4-deoxy-L-arabinose formyltransferase/UDP-glucuronic acid dehydrogenase (UDP-4-keto-hexauronic acid decarboxylating)
MVGLEALVQEKFDIQAIFSHPDDPGENIWFGSVAEWGKKKTGFPCSVLRMSTRPSESKRSVKFHPKLFFRFIIGTSWSETP